MEDAVHCCMGMDTLLHGDGCHLGHTHLTRMLLVPAGCCRLHYIMTQVESLLGSLLAGLEAGYILKPAIFWLFTHYVPHQKPDLVLNLLLSWRPDESSSTQRPLGTWSQMTLGLST